jgi:hypothetical protein
MSGVRDIPRSEDERILAALAMRDAGLDSPTIARRLGFGGASQVRTVLRRVYRDLAASEGA